jgi:hypothetical protein
MTITSLHQLMNLYRISNTWIHKSQQHIRSFTSKNHEQIRKIKVTTLVVGGSPRRPSCLAARVPGVRPTSPQLASMPAWPHEEAVGLCATPLREEAAESCCRLCRRARRPPGRETNLSPADKETIGPHRRPLAPNPSTCPRGEEMKIEKEKEDRKEWLWWVQ